MSDRLADKLTKLVDKAEELPESEQLRLIRKLDHRCKKLSSELRDTKKMLRSAEDEITALDDYEALVDATQTERQLKQFEAIKRKGASGNAAAVLCSTDWHAEEHIDPDTCNGLNAYDLDIAAKRIEASFAKFIRILDFARGLSNIDEVYLWLGGDLINGYIHEEMEESNFLGPTEAIVFIQDYVASGIDLLLDEVKLPLTVVTNFGNHGRSTKKRRISTGYKTSWEWLAYHNLARTYAKDNRVQWKIEKGYHNWVDIKGSNVRFHHGDGLRYGGGVGGLSIPVNKSVAQWNKSRRADYDIFGHYHTFLNCWNWLSVGCLCGFNAYAIEIKADYQPPSQAFVTIDRDRGPVMALPVFPDTTKRAAA